MKIRIWAEYFLVSILFLFLSGCENCDEPKRTEAPPLTDKEKAFIPNKLNDTLFFKDESGAKFHLVCLKNELEKDSYSDIGRKNPCEESIHEWEKQAAEFTGNILASDGSILKISISLSAIYNYYESQQDKCAQPTSLKRFILVANQQYFFGTTSENTNPVIHNFNFNPELRLSGQLFQKVNYKKHDACSADGNAGIDSIYYSGQYGLLRFTTTGGKKYQRVL